MLSRILMFSFGCVSYLVFLGTFLYAVCFIGNFGVSSTLDGPLTGSLAASIAIDTILLTLFAAQHSIMARRWFKEKWTQVIPKPIERSMYVLLSSLALILLFWQWRPLGGAVWAVENPIAVAVLRAFFGLGWGVVLVSTFLINHFELFGLQQVWRNLMRRDETPVKFVTPWLYKYVRHPLYVGWFLAFWMTPVMTSAHLLFSLATTAYILLAIQFEERDLVREHGDAYKEYREQVPMLVPFTSKKAKPAVISANQPL
jgi:methanethiol S-methyltransferase